MPTKTPQRSLELGAGRTEPLVAKVTPEVKEFLRYKSSSEKKSVTWLIEQLALEEMERTGYQPKSDA